MPMRIRYAYERMLGHKIKPSHVFMVALYGPFLNRLRVSRVSKKDTKEV